ncbi:hypothetical protein MTBBW1_300088 [Desulfamplus magnetovallimortis]|uniref:Uncharacterized protein n=1 Tax=Desulfamplus magnetovallimortis TaxID=1246637 RepID=A0A1W1HFV0_9BACT|nr:hypothetical protein MTBBW1_300088 [Desulfamplus magnetovallimortis]
MISAFMFGLTPDIIRNIKGKNGDRYIILVPFFIVFCFADVYIDKKYES